MARPAKDGLEYWPIDCGFFRDRKIKLLRKEFGVTGVYLVLLMLNKIYEGNGYYIIWDDDECALVSDECNIEDQVVNEVVKGCLRRSIFDNGVFQVFGVLTSRGIQKRYLNAIGHNRTQVTFIEEYFLLDRSDEKEVPKNTLGKVALKSIKTGKTTKLSEFSPGDPGKTSAETEFSRGKPPKEKKSKVKKSKEDKERENPGESSETPQVSSSLSETTDQEKLSKVFTYYTDSVNWQISSTAASLLRDYAKRMDAELIMRACDIAVDQKSPNWNYVWGILKNWDNNHVFTLKDLERHENRRQSYKRAQEDTDPYAKGKDVTGGYFTL